MWEQIKQQALGMWAEKPMRICIKIGILAAIFGPMAQMSVNSVAVGFILGLFIIVLVLNSEADRE